MHGNFESIISEVGKWGVCFGTHYFNTKTFFNKFLWDTLEKICCLLLLPEEYQCFSDMQPAVLLLLSDIVWWQRSAIYRGFPSEFSRFGTVSLEVWPSDISQREDAITRDPVGKTSTAEHHASVKSSFGVVATPPASIATDGDRPMDSQGGPCVSSYTGNLMSDWDTYQSHISKWVVEVVKAAYLSSDQDVPEWVTVHELRALALSWVYTCHIVRCTH